MPLNSAAEKFLAVWTLWNSTLPEALLKEDPSMLCRLLRSTDVDEGVTQKALGEEADIIQSKVSKLVKILRNEGWLEPVRRPGADKRLDYVRLTKRARRALANADRTLNVLLEPPTRLRSGRPRKLLRPASNLRIPMGLG